MSNRRHIPRAGHCAAGLGFIVAALAFAWLAPQAGATMTFVEGGFSTAPSPKVPAPEVVWVAHNDGSSPRRLTTGSVPVISPNGRLILYAVFTHGAPRLAVLPRGRWRVANPHHQLAGRPGSVVAGCEHPQLPSGLGTRVDRLPTLAPLNQAE